MSVYILSKLSWQFSLLTLAYTSKCTGRHAQCIYQLQIIFNHVKTIHDTFIIYPMSCPIYFFNTIFQFKLSVNDSYHVIWSSGRCPPKCAYYFYPKWLNTGFMNNFLSPFHWLAQKRVDMDNLFRKWIYIMHVYFFYKHWLGFRLLLVYNFDLFFMQKFINGTMAYCTKCNVIADYSEPILRNFK